MGLFLKNKLYRILATSRILNSFGSYLYNIVFVIYAASQYNSNWAVSFANIVMVLPTLFSLWVGIKADQTKRKADWMIWTAVLQAILFVVMALIINQVTLSVFSIVCLFNVISDVLSDYSGGLRLPIMQKNIAEEDMMEAYSFLQFASFICTFAGQVVGLWLLDISQQNFALVAVVNAGCFLASGLLLFFYKKKLTHDPVVEQTEQSFAEQMKDAVDSMKAIFQSEGTASFGAVLSAILVLNSLGGAIGAIFSIYFLNHSMFGLSYGQNLLLLNAVFMVAMILGSLFSKDYFSRLSINKIMVLTALVFAMMSLSYLLSLPAVVGVLILAFAAYLTGKVNPKIDSLLLANTPPELLARTNNLLTLLFTLAVPVGTVVFSSLASFNLLLCWGVFFLLSLVSIAMALRTNVPTEEPASDEDTEK